MEALLTWVWRALRGFVKFILHLWSGRSEVERICSKGWHDHEMTARFSRSLWHSSQLADVAAALFHPEAQPAHAATRELVEKIATVKKINGDNRIARVNLGHCVDHIKFVNQVIAAMRSIQHTAYNAGSIQHQQLLDSLWGVYKPDVRRNGGMITEDWGELGFQGRDPPTDFRGMGMLGLHQLLHFGKTDPTTARAILLDSLAPCYFPFAAVGINITSFVMQLLAERRFDSKLMQQVEIQRLHSGTGALEENNYLVEEGCNLLHAIYAEVFTTLHRVWLERKPTDIMAFPSIFNDVKSLMIQKYPCFQEDHQVYV